MIRTIFRQTHNFRLTSQIRFNTTATASTPSSPIGSTPKIQRIVDDIAGLNLLQVADLVSSLKTKLNIKDIAMPVMSAAAPVASSAGSEAAEPAKEVVEEKTIFSVKLEKYEATAKTKMIREIKSLISGINLVEAKKFVEGVPKVIKENLPKEEAEKMKKHLESLGATVILE